MTRCYDQGMPKMPMTCEWCGVVFYEYLSQRRHPLKFCTREHKAEWNKTQPGVWRGKKIPYYPRPNRDVKGEKNGRWAGGRRIDKDGYILIWKPAHPRADYHGYVREHRLVMEEHIGRCLEPQEVVHHLNRQKDDNNLENLQLLEDGMEHQRLHYHEDNREELKNHGNRNRNKKKST